MSYGDPFRPIPDLSIWEWAERNVNLSARYPSKRRGMYRAGVAPYVKGIFDAIQDDRINTITIEKGAQTGITLLSHVCLCYWIREDPDPVLIVYPNSDLGRSVSESRIQPLIEDSPYVSQELTEERDDFKKLEYVLRRCTVNITGSNSPANLSSRPARRLILDETDKYPEQSGAEARPINLAVERTSTYEELRKILEISTPTTEEGYIHQSYMRADQRKFYVPCPYCGEYHVMAFPNVRFDSDLDIEEAAKSAMYHCPNPACEKGWSQMEVRRAVGFGEWRATAKSHDATHVSFHLPKFYAQWVTWTSVVNNFLSSKDNPAELQNFVNSTLAEPWKEPPKKSVAQSAIYEIRDRNVYERGTIPTDGKFMLVVTTDIQAAHVVYTVWALDPWNHWLVDHGFLATMDDVDILRANDYVKQGGEIVHIQLGFMDTGYNTTAAYLACLERRGFLIPIKGEKGLLTRMDDPVKPSKIESFPGGKLFGGQQSLTLLHLHPTIFKNQMARAIDGEGDVTIHFHKDIDKGFVKQMTGEVLKETKPDKFGNVQDFWSKVGVNDFFDCGQYSFAFRHVLQNDLRAIRAGVEAAEKAEAAGVDAGGTRVDAGGTREESSPAEEPAKPKAKKVINQASYGGGEDADDDDW